MRKLLLIFFICSLTSNIFSQTKRSSIPLKHGSHRIGKRMDVEMQRWRDHGLGQFIHWGVYSIPGGHWNGKVYRGAAEWIRSWNEIPKADYDDLYKQFNPKDFKASAWAKQAKEMGAGYLIITTKHHDGFCLWKSKYTDYNISNTPYKKDILTEIVNAYEKEGIDVTLYFSIIDWNHPGYRSVIKSKEDSIAYESFLSFTHNQLLELLNAYPNVKGLWFDGTWDAAWIAQAARIDEWEKEFRTLRPGLIIGSRFRADENGKRHYDTNGDLIGDYDQTWERDMPSSMLDLNNTDWDCVMTVPENQWGYHSDWSLTYVKTSYELIEMLMKSVSMNGNFVLNFGPDGKGNIRKEESKLAKEIGEWMKINKEAVKGCSYANLNKQDWGYFTRKENKLYLSVFNRPINNRLTIEIPKGGFVPIKARFLENGQVVNIINTGKNKRNHSLYQVEIPKEYISLQPFVIVIEIDESTDSSGIYDQAKT